MELGRFAKEQPITAKNSKGEALSRAATALTAQVGRAMEERITESHWRSKEKNRSDCCGMDGEAWAGDEMAIECRAEEQLRHDMQRPSGWLGLISHTT